MGKNWFLLARVKDSFQKYVSTRPEKITTTGRNIKKLDKKSI